MGVNEFDLNSIDFPVPANEWQDYVDTIKTTLNQEPNPNGPSTATFKLKDGKTLNVKKLTTQSLLATPTYSTVADSSFVDIIHKLLPNTDQGKEPRDIQVVNAQGEIYNIRVAGTKFKSKAELVEKTGGVIHNPPD
jgi:hypothetical protein